MLKPSVFIARISNGHRLLTLAGGRAGRAGSGNLDRTRIGESVLIELAPGDFSISRIVGAGAQGAAGNENKKLS